MPTWNVPVPGAVPLLIAVDDVGGLVVNEAAPEPKGKRQWVDGVGGCWKRLRLTRTPSSPPSQPPAHPGVVPGQLFPRRWKRLRLQDFDQEAPRHKRRCRKASRRTDLHWNVVRLGIV